MYVSLLNVPPVDTFLSAPNADQPTPPTPRPPRSQLSLPGWIMWILIVIVGSVLFIPMMIIVMFLSAIPTLGMTGTEMDSLKPVNMANSCLGVHIWA